MRAASELGFDPKSAIMIGDKESDIECGRRAGATTVLIVAGASRAHVRTQADIIAPNLMEAAKAVAALRVSSSGRA
jgi:D-glycero-D-manno-heptose 1,7-bisphosphate phosphatase